MDITQLKEGRTEDALTPYNDEGRCVLAIIFGEVASDLRSGGFRMGKPHQVNLDGSFVERQMGVHLAK